MKKYLLLIIALVTLFSSCVSKKELTYLQDKNESQSDTLSYTQLQREDYVIQINDILNIEIKSLDEKTASIFNASSDNNGNTVINDAIIYIKGYSVDSEGNIDLPVIGSVRVEGLTLKETKKKIEKNLYKYFKKDAVFLKVQLAGIRYSVVGEINRPGRYVIYQNQANVFEAIANAGDITMVGTRNKVQIIRQQPEGVEIVDLDLTDKNVINSPYYFIQPNDVINIQPMRAKSWGIGKEGFATLVSILTLISTTLLIIVNTRQLSN